jgi:hypothetical protein
MSFRTMHFDGYARVPSYVRWVRDADLRATYAYHHKVLRLLQWHCPPRLWHLKTPVHMFALDDLLASYPDARFLWSHRDPAPVLASVCDLIAYTRSWVSDRDDSAELGPEELALWSEAVQRAMDFRARLESERGSGTFADVTHAELQTDPLGAVARAYDTIGIECSDATQRAVSAWARQHPPRSGRADYDLERYGLTEQQVRSAFVEYTARFDVL